MSRRFLSINAPSTTIARFLALRAAEPESRALPVSFASSFKLMVVVEIIVVVLVADFLSGFFHWLEDAYGRENWPFFGRFVTKPNILHHHDPRYFTRHSWFQSSWLLLSIGLTVLGIAWLFGVLTWQVWLVVILGTNANQVHKWAHRTPAENGPFVSLLQRIHLLQTPRHHGSHHTNPKNSHYCVLTNFLNPILDGIGLWDALEWAIGTLCGVRRRIDTSVSGFSHRPEEGM